MDLLLTIIAGLFVLFGIGVIFSKGLGSFVGGGIYIGSGMLAYDMKSFVPLVLGYLLAFIFERFFQRGNKNKSCF